MNDDVFLFIVDVHAGPGERFAPTAFDGQIGKSVPVSLPDSSTPRSGIVKAAVVSPDGQSAKLRIELPRDD